MQPYFERVLDNQIEALLRLMAELYEHESIAWQPEAAASTAGELLAHPERGSAWWIRVDATTAGYFVLTWAFSLEFGGTFGLLDELYIREHFRGRQVGSAALEFIEEQCRAAGARALRLEAGHGNADALRFYERHGFRRELRYLMTKRMR